jgi:hypothetical protein
MTTRGLHVEMEKERQRSQEVTSMPPLQSNHGEQGNFKSCDALYCPPSKDAFPRLDI